MSDSQLSAAEQRRQRFLQEKANSGGSVSKLIAQVQNRPWILFFDEQGEIQCFTQDADTQILDTWKTHEFSQDQLEILKEKELRKYRVRIDPKVDNLYSIELKPIEDVHKPSTEDFMYEVVASSDEDYEIACWIEKNHLYVQMNPSVKAEYKDIYPVSATRNGFRMLRFYITAAQDPHIMYEYKSVSIADLLTSQQVKRELGDNLEQCSIYTNKIFDRYVRK
jgi:hypothetical protein